jgi:eukaryotic-like serine/threonine-protein kinase
LEGRDERSRSSQSPGPWPVRGLGGGPAAAVSSDSSPGGGASGADATPRTIGRYALHSEIASGGMATIHIGRLLGPVGFARTVAIKRLHPPLARDPEFVAMFLDEARLAARIRHPNVVSTLDVVATEGELFVVMEYVPGESLARLLRAVRAANGIVPVPIAATIMVGVLHGLHAAHEAHDERGQPLRIVHRDVSPHNILVGTDGDAHLIDFGIAKARGRMQVTRQGQIKGKLSYMPAEQLMGQGLDHRADIFAASIVLWESLTGQRLYQGTDDGDVYAKVLMGKVDPPSLYAKGLSAAIDAIVLRGLARDRAQRYATAREMALALEAAIPLAPPSQVGGWVESLVGDALADRTAQIAGIERLVEAGAEGTSSALMTIGAGIARPANEQTNGSDTGARSTALPRIEQTSPTQQIGVSPPRGTDRAIDHRATASAGVDKQVRQASQAAPRGSSRPTLVAVGLLLVPLVAYASLHALRGSRRAALAAQTGPDRPAESHAAAPAASSPGLQGTIWYPVPVSSPSNAGAQASSAAPVASSPAAGAELSGSGRASLDHGAGVKKAATPAAPSARPIAPHGPAAPQTTSVAEAPAGVAPTVPAARPPGPSAPNCDPPFYIDADGTKRYKRYCPDP